MVQIQEISDEVAEKLAVSSKETAKSKDVPAAATATAAAAAPVVGPELPPALAMTSGKTAQEILADLNKSPLFMTELEENDDIAALQALAYEGTPLENAQDFKERGNECFREKQWADAREFYDKGVALLVTEDRRRARGEAPVREPDSETGELPPDPDTPEQLEIHRAVLEQLYANRAACQLSLQNYRSCTLDCGAALRLNPTSAKAWFRSARALLALDKIDEAVEACRGGLAADPHNTALQRLAVDIDARAVVVQGRLQAAAEREANAARKVARLRATLKARGIRTRSTDKPPDMADAQIKLVEPEDDGALTTDVSESLVAIPVILLYPETAQSDMLPAFVETETLGDYLQQVLPPPWDEPAQGGQNRYATAAAVDCFMETTAGGLVKVGKKMPLGKILTQAAVEVVDNLLMVYVLARDYSGEWVKEFKEKKAAIRSGQKA